MDLCEVPVCYCWFVIYMWKKTQKTTKFTAAQRYLFIYGSVRHCDISITNTLELSQSWLEQSYKLIDA